MLKGGYKMNEPIKKNSLRDAIGIEPDARPKRQENAQAIQNDQKQRQPATEDDSAARNVWKIQAEFLNRLDTQRSAINKAIEAAEPLEDILLKALECIAIMSGDQLFFTMNKAKLEKQKR